MSSVAVMMQASATIRCAYCKLNQFDRATCRRCKRPLQVPTIERQIEAIDAGLTASEMYSGACRVLPLAEALGVVLRQQRKRCGYTQEELARLLGVTAGTIHNWELGTSGPNLDRISELATEFDMRISRLMELTEREMQASRRRIC